MAKNQKTSLHIVNKTLFFPSVENGFFDYKMPLNDIEDFTRTGRISQNLMEYFIFELINRFLTINKNFIIVSQNYLNSPTKKDIFKDVDNITKKYILIPNYNENKCLWSLVILQNIYMNYPDKIFCQHIIDYINEKSMKSFCIKILLQNDTNKNEKDKTILDTIKSFENCLNICIDDKISNLESQTEASKENLTFQVQEFRFNNKENSGIAILGFINEMLKYPKGTEQYITKIFGEFDYKEALGSKKEKILYVSSRRFDNMNFEEKYTIPNNLYLNYKTQQDKLSEFVNLSSDFDNRKSIFTEYHNNLRRTWYTSMTHIPQNKEKRDYSSYTFQKNLKLQKVLCRSFEQSSKETGFSLDKEDNKNNSTIEQIELNNIKNNGNNGISSSSEGRVSGNHIFNHPLLLSQSKSLSKLKISDDVLLSSSPTYLSSKYKDFTEVLELNRIHTKNKKDLYNAKSKNFNTSDSQEKSDLSISNIAKTEPNITIDFDKEEKSKTNTKKTGKDNNILNMSQRDPVKIYYDTTPTTPQNSLIKSVGDVYFPPKTALLGDENKQNLKSLQVKKKKPKRYEDDFFEHDCTSKPEEENKKANFNFEERLKEIKRKQKEREDSAKKRNQILSEGKEKDKTNFEREAMKQRALMTKEFEKLKDERKNEKISTSAEVSPKKTKENKNTALFKAISLKNIEDNFDIRRSINLKKNKDNETPSKLKGVQFQKEKIIQQKSKKGLEPKKTKINEKKLKEIWFSMKPDDNFPNIKSPTGKNKDTESREKLKSQRKNCNFNIKKSTELNEKANQSSNKDDGEKDEIMFEENNFHFHHNVANQIEEKTIRGIPASERSFNTEIEESKPKNFEENKKTERKNLEKYYSINTKNECDRLNSIHKNFQNYMAINNSEENSDNNVIYGSINDSIDSIEEPIETFKKYNAFAKKKKLIPEESRETNNLFTSFSRSNSKKHFTESQTNSHNKLYNEENISTQERKDLLKGENNFEVIDGTSKFYEFRSNTKSPDEINNNIVDSKELKDTPQFLISSGDKTIHVTDFKDTNELGDNKRAKKQISLVENNSESLMRDIGQINIKFQQQSQNEDSEKKKLEQKYQKKIIFREPETVNLELEGKNNRSSSTISKVINCSEITLHELEGDSQNVTQSDKGNKKEKHPKDMNLPLQKSSFNKVTKKEREKILTHYQDKTAVEGKRNLKIDTEENVQVQKKKTFFSENLSIKDYVKNKNNVMPLQMPSIVGMINNEECLKNKDKNLDTNSDNLEKENDFEIPQEEIKASKISKPFVKPNIPSRGLGINYKRPKKKLFNELKFSEGEEIKQNTKKSMENRSPNQEQYRNEVIDKAGDFHIDESKIYTKKKKEDVNFFIKTLEERKRKNEYKKKLPCPSQKPRYQNIQVKKRIKYEDSPNNSINSGLDVNKDFRSTNFIIKSVPKFDALNRSGDNYLTNLDGKVMDEFLPRNTSVAVINLPKRLCEDNSETDLFGRSPRMTNNKKKRFSQFNTVNIDESQKNTNEKKKFDNDCETCINQGCNIF